MFSSLSRAKAFKTVSPRIRVSPCSYSIRHDSGSTCSKSAIIPPNSFAGLDAYDNDNKKKNSKA